MSLALTRHAAIRLGFTKYTAGRPCLRGHGNIRYTSSGACVLCRGDRSAAEYAAKSQEEKTAYRVSRREASREASKRYRERRKAA